MDSVLQFNYIQQHPFSAWLYPYTDWGLPVPGYTGPTPLLLGILYLSPTVLVRVVEFLSVFGAGLGVFWIIGDVRGTGAAALVAGGFYSLMAETPQFFEGHVPAMMSVAFAPVFLYLTFKFFRKPAARTGLPLAVVLYLMAAVGDLGLLYFYLFFGIMVAGYAIWSRHRAGRYTSTELVRVGLTASVFVALMLPWLVPYASGVRPQYTTGITTSVVAFSQTSAQPFWYSFAGFVSDNSFVTLVHQQATPSLALGVLWPLYLVIPFGITGFVIVQRSTGPRLLLLSGLLAMVFSTGKIYPFLSGFNGAVYTYLPYFDYDPSLFRWAVYGDLVLAVLLGILLTDLERTGLQTWRAFIGRVRSLRSSGRRPGIHDDRSAGHIARAEPTPSAPRDRPVGGVINARRALVATVMVAVCVTVVAQNWLVIAEPPGLFEFPSDYLAGFGYIDTTPSRGSVLTIPFGTDYEIAPWGGLSGSSLLMTPYFTDSDSVMFQAGTPYSLLLDSFIGNGLTLGLSNNVTKFLESTNVQYVAVTDYQNWTYPTSSVYPPQLSFNALANQTGLGVPAYQGGYQTVYSLPAYAGNVSWHSGYYVYFGSTALVYSILDQSWYNGSEPLVNGSELTFPSDDAFLTHATAIVSDPDAILNLNQPQATAIEASQTPVVVLVNSLDTPQSGGVPTRDLWNSSNGQVLVTQSAARPIQFALGSATTSLLQSASFNLSTRVECAPGATVYVSLDDSSVGSFTPSPLPEVSPLPYNDTSRVSVGDNSTVPGSYNGTIAAYQADGVTYLNWTVSHDDPRFQFVSFDFPNLGDQNGVVIDVASGSPEPLPLQLLVTYPTGNLTVPSYVVRAGEGGGPIEYAFTLPSGTWRGTGPAPVTMGSDSRLVVGLLDVNPTLRYLTLSNMSEFLSPPESFATESLGPTSLVGEGTMAVSAVSECKFDTLGLVPSKVASPSSPARSVRYLDGQPDPTDLEVGPVPTGWGLVELAQTYSSFWSLTGPLGASLHAPGDLGLNVWLINASSSVPVHIQYLGQALLVNGTVAEGAALPAVLLVWFCIHRATGRRRRGPVPTRSKASIAPKGDAAPEAGAPAPPGPS